MTAPQTRSQNISKAPWWLGALAKPKTPSAPQKNFLRIYIFTHFSWFLLLTYVQVVIIPINSTQVIHSIFNAGYLRTVSAGFIFWPMIQMETT